MRHSEKGLFNALEKILRGSGEPMDCTELYEHAEVREYAATPNRVSDYLGNMWRKGLVKRLATKTPGARSRWSYQWSESSPPGEGLEYAPKLLVDRPQVLITEEGMMIHIVTPHLTISIKQTPKA